MKILLEITEMVFAFIGVIWTMRLVSALIKSKPEDICKENYYIGEMRLTAKSSNNTVTLVNLYMKELENGKSHRDYQVIFSETSWEEVFWKSVHGIELNAWMNGGAFPHKFDAIEPLGAMLNRMMKKRLGVNDA